MRRYTYLCCLFFLSLTVQVENVLAAEQQASHFMAVQKAAEQGNVEAQYALGAMYFTGRGVTRDDAKAVQWFQKAADQGNPKAQYYLSVAYESGWGVTRDSAKAIRLRDNAAEQGAAEAQYALGLMYLDGDGISINGIRKDLAKAVQWFQRAADQGHAESQYYLGIMYAYEQGIPKDEVKAIQWFRKAAKQKYHNAQYFLSKIRNGKFPKAIVFTGEVDLTGNKTGSIGSVGNCLSFEHTSELTGRITKVCDGGDICTVTVTVTEHKAIDGLISIELVKANPQSPARKLAARLASHASTAPPASSSASQDELKKTPG
jgi:hypothetical protein